MPLPPMVVGGVGCTTKKWRSGRVAASRPKALAMVASHPKKAIAKLRVTMPPGNFLFALPQSCRTPVVCAIGENGVQIGWAAIRIVIE